MPIKNIAFNFIVLLVILNLSACGDTKQRPQAAAQKKKITYWSLNEPHFVEANKKIIEKFEAAFPDIDVDYHYFSYDTYYNKLKIAYLDKSESDVQQIFGSWVKYFAKNDFLSEISPNLMNKDAFYQVPVQGYTYKNTIYGIPREFNLESCGVLYYPDELKKLGYSNFPQNYSQLIDVAKKLTIKDDSGKLIHLGFDFVGADNSTFLFLTFILQQGESLWNTDGKHIKLTSQAAQKALLEMVDLINRHKVTDIAHYLKSDDDYFLEKKTSMYYIGPWAAAGYYGENLNFSYARMPSFGTKNAFAAESGWGEVVSSQSKQKDLCFKFVNFITNEENYQLFNEETNTIPAIRKIAQSTEFQKNNPFIKPLVGILDEGCYIGNIPDTDWFKDKFVYHLVKVVNNEESVLSALKTLESETNKKIDEVNVK